MPLRTITLSGSLSVSVSVCVSVSAPVCMCAYVHISLCYASVGACSLLPLSDVHPEERQALHNRDGVSDSGLSDVPMHDVPLNSNGPVAGPGWVSPSQRDAGLLMVVITDHDRCRDCGEIQDEHVVYRKSKFFWVWVLLLSPILLFWLPFVMKGTFQEPVALCGKCGAEKPKRKRQRSGRHVVPDDALPC